MLKLSRYLANYRLESLLSPLFKMIEAALSLVVPVVVASMIDVGVGQRDSSYVIRGGVLLVAIAVVGLLAALLAQYFAARAAAGMGSSLRNDLFSHVLSLSQADRDEFGEATLTTRICVDTVQVQDGFNRFFRLVLRSPFVIFGSLIMAFFIDRAEGLVFLAVICALFVVVGGLMRLAVGGYRKVQSLLDSLTARVAHNLSGKRTIRAYRREGYELDRFNEDLDTFFDEQLRVGRISALSSPLSYAAINAGLVALLWLGGQKVNVGALTTGEVVALVNYASQILVEVVKLATFVSIMVRSSASATRINELFETKSSMRDGSLSAPPATNSIEFRDVSLSYAHAQAPSLEHISFSLAPGETLGVIGGTGSGKTSLADLLMRTYDASSGEVCIGGRNIRDYQLSQLHSYVALVEQKAQLFAGSILDNLMWGAAPDKQQARTNQAGRDATKVDQDLLANSLSVAQVQGLLEQGGKALRSYIEEGGANLSGGQRQRLSIARALMHKPKILILDDASSALDYATEARLRAALTQKLQGCTLVTIAQRVSAVRHANKILVLDGGKQVGLGTHAELLRSCKVYRQICESQFGAGEVASA